MLLRPWALLLWHSGRCLCGCCWVLQWPAKGLELTPMSSSLQQSRPSLIPGPQQTPPYSLQKCPLSLYFSFLQCAIARIGNQSLTRSWLVPGRIENFFSIAHVIINVGHLKEFYSTVLITPKDTTKGCLMAGPGHSESKWTVLSNDSERYKNQHVPGWSSWGPLAEVKVWELWMRILVPSYQLCVLNLWLQCPHLNMSSRQGH